MHVTLKSKTLIRCCRNSVKTMVLTWSYTITSMTRGHLNKGKLHLNDIGISRFVRNFWDFLNTFETAWHESMHYVRDVSSSSSWSRYPSLSAIDTNLSKFQQQRIMYAKNTIICDLNVNSIRNKFDTLDNVVKAFDIFLLSESKLDNTLHKPIRCRFLDIFLIVLGLARY